MFLHDTLFNSTTIFHFKSALDLERKGLFRCVLLDGKTSGPWILSYNRRANIQIIPWITNGLYS